MQKDGSSLNSDTQIHECKAKYTSLLNPWISPLSWLVKNLDKGDRPEEDQTPSKLQGCIKFNIIKYVGEEYQVLRGGGYHGCGKRERESNIIFPMILRLFGRISNGEEGKGEENQDFKNLRVGKNIKLKRTYTP